MQKENSSGPVFPNLISSDAAGIGRTLTAVQMEFIDTLDRANRAWFACCSEEATLASNFAKKVTAAGSIPEAAAAYQEWASQQMELFSRQAQNVFAETQDFTKACARIMGNGKGLGSS
jgi:hypothetical protein